MRKLLAIIILLTLPFTAYASVEFSGSNDWVAFTSPTQLDNIFTSGVGGSISAWFYARSQGEGNAGVIIAKADSSANGRWFLQFDGTAGSNKISFNAVFSGTDLDVRTNAIENIYNKWNNIVVTWDGSTTATNCHIYINGVEGGYSLQQNATLSYDDSTENFYIGDYQAGAGNNTFNGYVEDVALWKGVILKIGEVKAIAGGVRRTPNQTQGQALVGYWNLIEVGDQTSADTAVVFKDRSRFNEDGSGGSQPRGSNQTALSWPG